MKKNCGNKIEQSCTGTTIYDVCVKSQLTPPPYSSLESCFTTRDVDVDQYEVITKIKSEIDMTSITSTCLTVPATKEVNDFIQQLYNEICIIKSVNATQVTQIATLQAQMAVQQARICP